MKETRDILTLFEALNSHEVFTPPRIARDMLSLLPKSIWSDPRIRILDPCTKTGVFLRESFFLLYDGLQGAGLFKADDGETYDLSDHQQRINHILKNMLYGIATSELTGYMSRRTLYGVMEANIRKEDAAFDSFVRSESFNRWSDNEKYHFLTRNTFNTYFDPLIFSSESHAGFEHEGNIFYPVSEVTRLAESHGVVLEDTYFPFVDDRTKHGKILDIKGGNMFFDVIIGNPPYQTDTGGSGRQAKPIYQEFVNQAKSLKPRYLSMITPARWYAGGFGLDSYRESMMNDRSLRYLVDFESATSVFPGVDVAGGICYFLIDRDYDGDCTVITNRNGERTEQVRPLNEFDIIVRDSRAISILRKVLASASARDHGVLSPKVSPIRPFGLPTNYKPESSGIPCWFIQKYGRQYADPASFTDRYGLKDKWKVLIPKAPIAGQTDFSKPIRIYHEKNVLLARPGEICTESYIVAGAFDNELSAIHFRQYLFTKLARFLILLTIISQDVNKKNFRFLPDLGDYSQKVDDAILVEMWGISESEWSYINERIKPVIQGKDGE